MVKSILINPDGSISNVEPKNGTDFTLDELQGFVGGYIEIIHPTTGRLIKPYQIAVCNEEGLNMKLPCNPIASVICNTYLVGSVLLTSEDMVR